MRRVLVVLLVLALPLFVGACGGGSTENTGPETIEGAAPEDDATTGGGGGGGDTGGADEGDAAAGKEIFASAGCGNCHALEDAGTNGTTGPNLDESEIDFEGAVQQISNGGGGMPPFEGQLSEQEIADVAAYVTGG